MPAHIATPRLGGAPYASFSSPHLEPLAPPLGATRRLCPSTSGVRRYVSTPLCASAAAATTTPRRFPADAAAAAAGAALEFDSDSDTSSRSSSAHSTPLPPSPPALAPEHPDSRPPSPAMAMAMGRHPVPIGGVAMQRTSCSLGCDGNPFAQKQRHGARARERGLSDPPSPSPGNVRALRPAASVMTIRTVEWTA